MEFPRKGGPHIYPTTHKKGPLISGKLHVQNWQGLGFAMFQDFDSGAKFSEYKCQQVNRRLLLTWPSAADVFLHNVFEIL